MKVKKHVIIIPIVVVLLLVTTGYIIYSNLYATLPDKKIHDSIQEIDLESSTVLTTKYIDDYETYEYLLTHKEVDELELKNALYETLSIIEDTSYERDTLRLGSDPMIEIKISYDDKDILFYYFGYEEELTDLNMLLVVYPGSHSTYDNTLLYNINHNDFLNIYLLFYDE